MANEMKCLWYEDEFFSEFLTLVMRAEYEENPRVYTKAIRSTLIALGYDENYINGEFRERMENYFKDLKGI